MKKIKFIIMLLLTIALGASAQTSESISELTRKAEAGDAQAQFKLGKCYDEGNSVNVDKAEAIKWIIKAANNKHPDAAALYGLLLIQDAPNPTYNITPNIAEGVKYLKIAAFNGNNDSAKLLASAFFAETILRQDVHGISNYISFSEAEKLLDTGVMGDETETFRLVLKKIKAVNDENTALIKKYGQKAFDNISNGKVYVGMPEGIITAYKTLEDDGSRYQLFKYDGMYRDKIGSFKKYVPTQVSQLINMVGEVFPRIIKVRNGKVTHVVY